MEACEALDALGDDVRYLQQNVYVNPAEAIDRVDPIRGGTSKWTEMSQCMKKVAHTPVTDGLYLAFGKHMKERPASIAAGITILQRMGSSIAAIRHCLELSAEKFAPLTATPKTVQPRMDWLRETWIAEEAWTKPGQAVGLEKKFFDARGLKPFELEDFRTMHGLSSTMERACIHNRTLVGMYVTEMNSGVLHVLSWATSDTPPGGLVQVPEVMARDLLTFLGENSAASPLFFDEIGYTVPLTHAKAVEAPTEKIQFRQWL